MRKNSTHEISFLHQIAARLSIMIVAGLLLLSIGYRAWAQSTPTAAEVAEAVDNGLKTYSGEMLRSIHPTDLWEAIKMADPSVVEADGNLYGSDPNSIPGSVDMSLSSPWQSSGAMPVFILDGAVVNIRRVRDLNIHLVQSVTIRNDAAALAGYGLRGGNGIIEIRTVRPEEGPMRLRYSLDGSFQWADISSCNLMNASEKLDLEQRAGLYADLPQLLAERGGNDKDWLRVPLKGAFQHRHMIDVYGGDRFVKYSMGLRLAPSTAGVMRGSKRNVYGADAYIEYRYRSLVISNMLSVDKISAQASNYGKYDYYTTINPYYLPADANGIMLHLLGEGTFNEQINPVYETSLGSMTKAETWAISDNLYAALELGAGFSLDGRFTFAKEKEQTDFYISPSSAVFSGSEISEAGIYHIGHRNYTTYEGDISLRYNGKGDHARYGAVLSGNVFQGMADRDYYGGRGIPSDQMRSISFSTAYDHALKPDAIRIHDRTLSGTFFAWYDFDSRYHLDVSARIDKSSRLAQNRQTAWYYGISAAWNLHNEAFLRESEAIRRLTLRAALSTTGAIDFSEADHTVRYSYNTGNEYIYDYFLIGAGINSLPNPDLRPRTVVRRNVRLSAETKWFSMDFDFFRNTSRDLLILSRVGLATGYDDMPDSGGEISTGGIMFSLRSPVIAAGNVSLRLYANGIHHRSVIESLPGYFGDEYNGVITDNYEALLASGLRPGLLAKGESPSSIWAVRSAGVDASGNETFFDRDGNRVTEWKAADMVPIGDATPKLRGALGVQAAWRQWSAQLQLNYSLGGRIYNETLHAVQNGSLAMNGDRRMADPRVRVNNPEQILATSRFVETNNEFSLGSIRMGYALQSKLLEKLGMQSMQINLTGNNLIHSTSADYQRGIYYPYARTLTISLSAIF